MGLKSLPIIAEDVTTELLIYEKYGVLNRNRLVDVPEVANNTSEARINLEFDFNLRQVEYVPFGILDLAMNFGALKSFIYPFVTTLILLMALTFIHRLATIIQKDYD